MNRICKSILFNLIINDNSLKSKDLIEGFPDRLRNEVIIGLHQLQNLDYLRITIRIDGDLVKLNPTMFDEALKIVKPDFKVNNPIISYSELIPRSFTNSPFLIAEGEKEIKGNVSTYWFCKKTTDEDSVSCFVFNKNGLSLTVHFGKLSDGNSLISRALRSIDGIFAGRDSFTKAELTHRLPYEIVGNRQPLKAILEYLYHEKFLVKIDNSKYRRTGKKHQFTVISNSRLSEYIEGRNSRIESSTIAYKDGVYSYTDEFGLYPVLK